MESSLTGGEGQVQEPEEEGQESRAGPSCPGETSPRGERKTNQRVQTCQGQGERKTSRRAEDSIPADGERVHAAQAEEDEDRAAGDGQSQHCLHCTGDRAGQSSKAPGEVPQGQDREVREDEGDQGLLQLQRRRDVVQV